MNDIKEPVIVDVAPGSSDGVSEAKLVVPVRAVPREPGEVLGFVEGPVSFVEIKEVGLQNVVVHQDVDVTILIIIDRVGASARGV